MTAPWGSWLNAGDPNAGGGVPLGGPGLLTPAQIQGIPLAQQAPMPFARQPSILDRLSARLFPTGAYTGLLDPEAQQGLQHQGLLGLGTSLLQQSGPSPYRIPLGAAIGNALQQSQASFPQMADQALRLQAFKAHAQRQAALQQLGGQMTQSGADPAAMIRQAMPLFLDDPETLKALSEAVKSLGAGEAKNLQEVKDIVDTRLGSATVGQRGTGLVDTKGRLQQFYPAGQAPMKPEEILPFAKDFEGAIAPHALAKQSYDTYQSTTDQGPIADQARLAAAINVVLPGSHVTPAQLSDPATAADFKGVPLIGPIIGALDPKTHTLPPAERRALDSIVANAARLRKQESATITQQKMGLAPPGINASLYARDPWNPAHATSKRPPLKF